MNEPRKAYLSSRIEGFMRLVTHYVFTFAATLLLTPLLAGIMRGDVGGEAARTAFAAVSLWLSLSVNYVIDRAGHTRRVVGGRGGIPVRDWRTHSVYTAPIWGVLLGLSTALLYLYAQYGFNPFSGSWPAGRLGVFGVFGLLGAYASYTHLFLDSLTEGGVYTRRHRRVALAHFRYNNPALNFAVILVSLFAAYYAWTHAQI